MIVVPAIIAFFICKLLCLDSITAVFRTWECAAPQGLRFDSPRCQFRWANL